MPVQGITKTKKMQQIISGKAKSNPQGFSKKLRKAIFDRVAQLCNK
jgi:hypothetical protein